LDVQGALIEPLFIPGSFELAFFNRNVDDKTENSVNRCGIAGSIRQIVEKAQREF
jgi:hypothetical protein